MSDTQSHQKTYQVLARKYRPDEFGALIGQDFMIKTLEQAFLSGRISHAFMLTGVRGVGKTTTARLLARALNYETADGRTVGPSIDLSTYGVHCELIKKGTHPDVLELDAATKTGVADMRDLLDNTRYAPSVARYRVYIIDEVHMLTMHSFNALLKTLEEPPDHVKFIFATTEIRKVPITVLSRCQRFDLRRLSTDELDQHLTKISELEGGAIAPEGMRLLARAAEGSVRDGLSLLDQALLQARDSKPISVDDIRGMLGLMDQSENYKILENTLTGDIAIALATLDKLVQAGALPDRLFQFFLDALAELSSYQITQTLSDDFEFAEIIKLAEKLDGLKLTRLWKLALEVLSDLKRAPDPYVAARMGLIALSQAAKLPSPQELLANLAQQTPPPPPKNMSGHDASSGQLQQSVRTFADVLALVDTKANSRLVLNLRKFVQPETVSWGKITCGLERDAPDELITNFALALKQATGFDWAIEYVEQADALTLDQEIQRDTETTITELKKNPQLEAFLDVFPDAEIIGIRPTLH